MSNLTGKYETSTLGFDVEFNAAASITELRSLLTDEQIVAIVNSNSANHGHLSKVRPVVFTVVEGYTGIKRKTKLDGDKAIPDERGETYVERAKAKLDAAGIKELEQLVQQALTDKGLGSLGYVAAARKAGGSITKGLAAFVKMATAMFRDATTKYKAAYVAKGIGVAEDFDEEVVDGELPSHIEAMARYLKNKAEEQQRALMAAALD